MIQAINHLAAAIVVWHALAALDAMTRKTRLAVWAGFAALALGAGMQLAATLEPGPWCNLGTALENTGLAILYTANRRACHCPACTRPEKEATHEPHHAR